MVRVAQEGFRRSVKRWREVGNAKPFTPIVHFRHSEVRWIPFICFWCLSLSLSSDWCESHYSPLMRYLLFKTVGSPPKVPFLSIRERSKFHTRFYLGFNFLFFFYLCTHPMASSVWSNINTTQNSSITPNWQTVVNFFRIFYVRQRQVRRKLTEWKAITFSILSQFASAVCDPCCLFQSRLRTALNSRLVVSSRRARRELIKSSNPNTTTFSGFRFKFPNVIIQRTIFLNNRVS